jgi:hypothetical protein
MPPSPLSSSCHTKCANTAQPPETLHRESEPTREHSPRTNSPTGVSGQDQLKDASQRQQETPPWLGQGIPNFQRVRNSTAGKRGEPDNSTFGTCGGGRNHNRSHDRTIVRLHRGYYGRTGRLHSDCSKVLGPAVRRGRGGPERD